MSKLESTLALAIDLFNQQAFFECHEVLEDLWRPLPPSPEKTFLQGLLQVGVGYYHWQNGNYTGTKNKLEAGLDKLKATIQASNYPCPVPLALLIAAVQADLNRVLTQTDRMLPPYPANAIPQLERLSNQT